MKIKVNDLLATVGEAKETMLLLGKAPPNNPLAIEVSDKAITVIDKLLYIVTGIEAEV